MIETNENIGPDPNTSKDDVLLVAKEVAHVSKRLVETGRTKVHIGVTERDEDIAVLLARSDVQVVRTPVDRVVTDVPPVRTEGDTVIIPIVKERVVVQKQLVVTEELRVSIAVSKETSRQTVRLREEHATVEVDETPHPTK